MTAAQVEPLSDGELDEVRNDLRNGANCVLAWTVRGLLARLERAEGERDRETGWAERLGAHADGSARTIRDLRRVLGEVTAHRDRLAAENRALHGALAYQASIVGRVEEVAAWGAPVSPDTLRVALDPALSLQGAEEATHAAAERVPEP